MKKRIVCSVGIELSKGTNESTASVAPTDTLPQELGNSLLGTRSKFIYFQKFARLFILSMSSSKSDDLLASHLGNGNSTGPMT